MGWLLGGMGASTNPGDYRVTMPNSGSIEDMIRMGTLGAQNQQAPQLDPTQQAQFRAGQMQQMQQLQGIASGQQQGAGELAAQRQVQNALAGQQAMARMGHGQNAALSARNAARNSAGIGLAGAGMGQQAAMQDQMGAQGLLTNAMGQGRGQDLGMAGQNANLSQQQNQINNQMYQAMLQQMTGMSQAQMQAQNQAMGASLGQPGLLGGLLSAGGTIGAAAAMHSDERLKTDVEDADADIDDMLDKLHAKNYRYKNQKHGEGPRAGIMAQDLERSRAGSRLVRELPDGKGVDVNAALSASLASVARLNKRLRKLEGKAA